MSELQKVIEFYQYRYRKFNNVHYHYILKKQCIWCNSRLPDEKYKIIRNDATFEIPYCSRKCRDDDSNSTIIIERLVDQCLSFKDEFLQSEELSRKRKQENEKSDALRLKKRMNLYYPKAILVAIVLIFILILIKNPVLKLFWLLMAIIIWQVFRIWFSPKQNR
jgi:hypothetical protein